MKKYTLMFLMAIFCLSSAFAQDAEKEYFDVSGKKATESQAYYYRVLETKPNLYKAYYMSGKLYFEGKIAEPLALEIETILSSNGWRRDSRTLFSNSGNSSKKSTPLCARVTSPGFGFAPPPIIDT